MTGRRSLETRLWPEADRVLWRQLFADDGPLDDRGPLAHLRKTSPESLRWNYAYWLGWLQREAPHALGEPPAARATAERLDAWIKTRAALAPMSRFTMVEAVLHVLAAAAPNADWTRQRRLLAHLRRAAFDDFGARKLGRIVSANVLVEAGLDMIASAERASTPLQAARRRRDGLLIAFLALLPMRLRALCALQINQHLLELGTGFVIHLPRALCKSGGPWEAPLPSLLEAPMRRYLLEVRPWLMSRSGAAHDRLWVGDRGQPVAQAHLSNRIARLTERSTGVRVRPHFFRDCAATTLARRSPDAARLIRPVLGHSSYRTSERHYNHAEAIDAGRAYADLIGALRDAGE